MLYCQEYNNSSVKLDYIMIWLVQTVSSPRNQLFFFHIQGLQEDTTSLKQIYTYSWITEPLFNISECIKTQLQWNIQQEDTKNKHIKILYYDIYEKNAQNQVIRSSIYFKTLS